MNKKFENSLWAFSFLLVGLAYVFGLFVDLTGDSGLYAAISRQMVESGDWFNLKINGEAYDQKPHLFFWLAGAGIQLFGNTNFAFKLFPFLYGLTGIYFTYRLGKLIYSVETGKIAALIAGTSQIFFLYFFDYHTDSVLQTGVVLALWQLAAFLKTQKPRNFVFGFIGVGLAMLSKGPIGAVIPFFAVLLFLLVKKDFQQLVHPKWFLGILISAVIISPSLIYLYQNFGFAGLKFYFITNNFGRITGDYAGSSNDYFFYIHTLLWAFLPWTIFVLTGLFLEVKSWFRKNTKIKWGVYLLGSVLLFTLILSVAKGKAPNYFLIAISPISVVATSWLVRIKTISANAEKNLFRAQWIFTGIFLLFFGFMIAVFSEGRYLFPAALLLLALSAFVWGIRSKKQTFRQLVLVTLTIAASLNLYLNAKVLPDLYAYQGAKQVLDIYKNQNSPETQLYNFELEEYELFFYAKNPVIHVKNWEELYTAMQKPGTWLYTNEIKYKDIIQMNYNIDTVYQIRQRGMNRISFDFLNPKTRESTLKTNYLFVVSKN